MQEKTNTYRNGNKAHIPPYILFLGSLLVIQLFIFLCFRLVFLFANFQRIDPATYKFFKLVFLYGFRFDLVVSSLILTLPYILLSLDYFFEIHNKLFYWFIKSCLLVSIVSSFLICSADIPFYTFFNARLTNVVFLWKDNFGDSLDFILHDRSKYQYFLLLILISVIFIYVLFKLQRKLFKENSPAVKHNLVRKLAVVSLSGGLLIIGIRGGISSEALSIKSLKYTNHYFINQLSWNPVLSFFDSFSSFPLNYLNEEQALSNANRFLDGEMGNKSPIARQQLLNEIPIKANVVLVIMESMSTDKIGQFGNINNLTPNLDVLAKEGLNFIDFYSCGIHTCNGIYGTLFSFPSLMSIHPMNSVESTNQLFTGLFYSLSQNNYQTVFICTNNESFDNMGNFVRNNGCSKVYGYKDFPKEKVVSSWGPPDEVLFDFALHKLNELGRNPEPFFATLVTISTHEPYVMPGFTQFKPRSTDKIDQLYEYADWSIGRFMDECKRQPWFNNTIFVFTADHGINSNSSYEAPLSFHHSPFIIYSPGMIKEPKTFHKAGIQLDVFPTVMGLLKIPYINNTFGIDLVNQSRPYAYFTHDDKLGCVGEDYYLIVNKEGQRFMYKYREKDTRNYINEKGVLADTMQTYAMSMLQTAQWMIMNRRVGPVNIRKK